MEIATVTKPAQPVISMTALLSPSELPHYIGQTIIALLDYAKQQPDIQITNPFVAYHDMTTSGELDAAVKVEVGIGLNQTISSQGSIKSYTLPSYQAVQTLHTGDYDQLQAVYQKLMQKIKQIKGTFLNHSFEYYLTDETIPLAKQETLIELVYK